MRTGSLPCRWRRWAGLSPYRKALRWGRTIPIRSIRRRSFPTSLAAPAQVRLDVFNTLGQPMATLVDGEQGAGAYSAQWDGTDAAGQAAAAGLYFYRLTVDGAQQTGRMVLVDGQAGIPMGGGRMVSVAASAADDAAYGLVVAGQGLVTYVDADFDVAAGMPSVVLEVEAQPDVRMKVVQSGLLGDVDNNGRVDIADALVVAVYSANPSISLAYIARGDVNCDGQPISWTLG